MFNESFDSMPDDNDSNDKDFVMPDEDLSDDSDFVDQMPRNVDSLRDEIKDYVASGLNTNTTKKIHAAVNKFKKFIRDQGQEKDMLELEIEYVDALLAVFLKGVKWEDGNDYEQSSVQSFSSCIHKYLSDNMRGIDPEKSFLIAKSALGWKKQELKSLAKGNRPNHAKCLT